MRIQDLLIPGDSDQRSSGLPAAATTAACGFLALLLLASGPVSADWLVLKDGTELETQGPWKEKGRVIVFTTTEGSLSSIRASEVDLELSRTLTERSEDEGEEKAAAESAPPPPPPPPILVLTDADVNQIDPEDLEEEESEEPAADQPLRIASWDQEASPDGEGVIVSGILRNDGPEVASRIEVTVQILDPDGTILGTEPAQLTTTTLNSGETLNFRTLFRDVDGFDTARFEINNRAFRPIPPVPPTDGGAADAEPAQDADGFEEAPR